MSLLTVENIRKNYFERPVLDGISFCLNDGDRLALIGINGAGKSTLMKIISGQEKADSGKVILAGGALPGYLAQHADSSYLLADTAIHDQELTELENKLRETEQAIAQISAQAADHPADADTVSQQNQLMSLYSHLTARFETAGGYDFAHRMQEALFGLGLSREVFERPIQTLSGGERMRVELARILLRSPDLLLLDEPTNHLDAAALEWLENYLTRFRGAVMLISHDRTFIDRTATAVAHLTNGSLQMYPGNYSHFRQIQMQTQAALQRQADLLSKELDREQAVAQTMRSHRKMSSYHSRQKSALRLAAKLEKIKTDLKNDASSLHFRFMPGQLDGAPDKILVEASDLTFSYGEKPLLDSISLSIRRGDKICLCGPNGCGKTTFLSLLLGRIKPVSGCISLSRQAVFGYMGQQLEFAEASKTLLETVTGLYPADDTAARSQLARFGFKDTDVFKTVQVLSGGERSRLYLCCLLMEQPDMLFLDEPTNHLDIDSREILENALAEFSGSIISVSHDRYFIEKCAGKILGFMNGRLQTYDQYEDYRSAIRLAAVNRAENNRQAQDESRGLQTKIIADNVGTSGRTSGINPEKVPARENPAQSRRRIAMQKQEKARLERSIETLEEEKRCLESTFESSCEPELYEQYARLLADIEQHYEQLIHLSE